MFSLGKSFSLLSLGVPYCYGKIVHEIYKGGRMIRGKESFMTHYSKYGRPSETEQIRELLNVDSQCPEDAEPMAQNTICSFVSQV